MTALNTTLMQKFQSDYTKVDWTLLHRRVEDFDIFTHN